ncbi:hypothetical protein HPP92_027732 [Vanilla planifolia]|uniref:Ig-like domain-containing protein n=1 Tax=Vanilla planifolia TaxID=51239 RepID=A0A835U5J1_VANPL|nr:hypothetical protein HPP92_027732 [Vanilla planifolia]
MGSSSSKNDGNKAQNLCKERIRYIKQALDLRFALSAAQLSYTQSLRNVGAALSRFTEADGSLDPAHSISELDKTPTRPSYASPSPSSNHELLGSTSHGGLPYSPRLSNVSYMKTAGSSSVRVTLQSSSNHYDNEDDDEDVLTFPVPPPPPFPEISPSWDFFDPVSALDGIKIPNDERAMRQHFDKFSCLRQEQPSREEVKLYWTKELSQDNVNSLGTVQNATLPKPSDASQTVCYSNSISNSMLVKPKISTQKKVSNVGGIQYDCSGVHESAESTGQKASPELCKSKTEKDNIERRTEKQKEDVPKLITQKAKDFLSSIKDIEHRFIRASESGHEVSRMLETRKIRLSAHSEIIGKSSESFVSVLNLFCCKAENLQEQDSTQHVTKVITWKRSVSSQSSSSRNPLTSASKDDASESGNDFIEEFSMISGSHSSTLDRLYAWERKLYDELKASESIRKAYDQKCSELRHQFAKDTSSRVIDKTRAAVKDLHSRVRVAIQAVDIISRRIEKMRDEELYPQLAELMHGFIRMWKALLECHQAQYSAISLAFHVKNSTAASYTDSYKQAVLNLRNEFECFRSSFAIWVGAQKSYIEALNSWLQKCILQPQERLRGRKVPFFASSSLSPSYIRTLRDWLAGIHQLPVEEVCNSMKVLVMVVNELLEHQKEEKPEDCCVEGDGNESNGKKDGREVKRLTA